jgi:hypothetical protein
MKRGVLCIGIETKSARVFEIRCILEAATLNVLSR